MSESHAGGFHRPVQKLVDSLIPFCRPPQGKKECTQIPPSAPKKNHPKGWFFFGTGGGNMILSARSARGDKRPPAAGGRERAGACSAAVEKPEDQRKPERFFGHRKVGESLLLRHKNTRRMVGCFIA